VRIELPERAGQTLEFTLPGLRDREIAAVTKR
jgi:hypothetical protein